MPFQDIRECFADSAELIAKLRRERPEFDEICRDYEDVQQEAARLAETEGTQDLRWLATLEETLTALHEEIALALRNEGGPPTLGRASGNDSKKNISKNGDKHAL